MGTVLIHKTTGRIGEYQSHARQGTLLNNIKNSGQDETQWEERVTSFDGYKVLFKNDPTRLTEREIQDEEKQISDKEKQVKKQRDRREAIRQLKLEGKTFKHFDNNGDRILN